jgi:hypothetical protein
MPDANAARDDKAHLTQVHPPLTAVPPSAKVGGIYLRRVLMIHTFQVHLFDPFVPDVLLQ